jgi:hypothetical protein
VRPPNLFFKIVLAIWGPLKFYVNFRISTSISEKNGDFDGDCMNSVDHFD